MSLISGRAVPSVLDIKLIRTDTTLDLSQKAEKVCFCRVIQADRVTDSHAAQ